MATSLSLFLTVCSATCMPLAPWVSSCGTLAGFHLFPPPQSRAAHLVSGISSTLWRPRRQTRLAPLLSRILMYRPALSGQPNWASASSVYNKRIIRRQNEESVSSFGGTASNNTCRLSKCTKLVNQRS